MKKAIIFTWEYLDTKKLSKSNEDLTRDIMFKECVTTFKKQMSHWFDKDKIKIVNTYLDDREIVIEFDEKIWGGLDEGLYGALRSCSVVEQIDSILRPDVPDKMTVIRAGIEKLKKKNAK
jgi:hypothetical protein